MNAREIFANTIGDPIACCLPASSRDALEGDTNNELELRPTSTSEVATKCEPERRISLLATSTKSGFGRQNKQRPTTIWQKNMKENGLQ
jgi:hypothetical protein